MSNLKIRRMAPVDGGAVAEMARDLGYDVSLRQVCEQISALDTDNQAIAYVATIGTEVVGWIQAHDRRLLQYPRVLEIGGIAIVEQHRGEGIGRRLVSAVESWGRARGHTTLFVRSSVTRAVAHEFYERVGFEREKTSYTFSRHLPPRASVEGDPFDE